MGINLLAINVLSQSSTYRIEEKGGSNPRRTPVQYQNRLIHEHDFTTLGVKDANITFVVICITCGEEYCGLCGKVLHKESRLICPASKHSVVKFLGSEGTFEFNDDVNDYYSYYPFRDFKTGDNMDVDEHLCTGSTEYCNGYDRGYSDEEDFLG
jgi:hypothetical protein